MQRVSARRFLECRESRSAFSWFFLVASSSVRQFASQCSIPSYIPRSRRQARQTAIVIVAPSARRITRSKEHEESPSPGRGRYLPASFGQMSAGCGTVPVWLVAGLSSGQFPQAARDASAAQASLTNQAIDAKSSPFRGRGASWGHRWRACRARPRTRRPVSGHGERSRSLAAGFPAWR
jgi:hypothetical protein